MRWGKEGDYRTSPHRTELFAATFARYFSKLHHHLSSPADWTILEAGAGDGTFAFGVLSTLRDEYPEVFCATKYLVDEVSDNSRSRLTVKLGDLIDHVQFSSLHTAQEIEVGVVFSNELLDALPVHLVTLTRGELSELHVDLDEKGGFVFLPSSLSSPELKRHCDSMNLQLVEGQVVEVNLAAEEFLSRAAQLLSTGYLVTVDYGADEVELYSRIRGTLRAFAKHQFVDDVLSSPGDSDITSTINWTRIKQRGEQLGLEVIDFLSQDQFLLQEGALVELQTRLDRAHGEAERLQLTTAARDLILPGGMSSSFQVLVQQRRQDYEKQ